LTAGWQAARVHGQRHMVDRLVDRGGGRRPGRRRVVRGHEGGTGQCGATPRTTRREVE